MSLLDMFTGTSSTSASESGTLNETASNSSTNYNNLFSDDNLQLLLQQLAQQMGGGSQFTRENAITDSQNLAKAYIQDSQNSLVPQLFNAQLGTGAYNDTATQAVANSANADIGFNAAQIEQQGIKNYADLSNQNNQSIAQLFQILSGAQTTGGSASNSSLDRETTGQSIGTSSDPASGILGQLTSSKFGLL